MHPIGHACVKCAAVVVFFFLCHFETELALPREGTDFLNVLFHEIFKHIAFVHLDRDDRDCLALECLPIVFTKLIGPSITLLIIFSSFCLQRRKVMRKVSSLPSSGSSKAFERSEVQLTLSISSASCMTLSSIHFFIRNYCSLPMSSIHLVLEFFESDCFAVLILHHLRLLDLVALVVF